MHLGLDVAEHRHRIAWWITRDTERDSFEREIELVRGERLLGGARVQLGGAPALSTEREMPRDHHCIRLARHQPLGGEAMAEGAILVGERGIRGLTKQRVAESVVLL